MTRLVTATDRAREIALAAAQAAADKLATDVVLLDVSDRLVITDVFVIASAPNERQVESIVEAIEERLRRDGVKPVRRASVRAAGSCSTSPTSSCTCSMPRSALSTLWNGSGRTARPSRSSTGLCPRRPAVAARTGPAGDGFLDPAESMTVWSVA